MPSILGANTLSSGSYDVANSVRFDDGDSPSMFKTPGSAGDQRTWTFSTWFKRGNIGSSQWILDAYDGSSDEFHIYISSGNAIGIYTTGGGFGNNLTITSSNLVRDTSAWYHLVVRCDTTQGTASNRLRIYLNGTEVSYGTYNNFTENGQGQVSESGTKHWIGRRNAGDYFDGYFAEMVLVDGSSLAPTSFGEFDSDTPTVWKPKKVSGLTFGTNGFYLDFQDSSNLGNDANGGTDFTEANLAATDQSTDTCTNNHATLDNLAWTTGSGLTFSQGNLKLVNSAGDWRPAISNIAVTKGKWYAEVKVTDIGSASKYGIIDVLQYNDGFNLFYNLATGTRAWTYRGFQGKVYNNTNDEGGDAYGNSFTTNDIIGIYLDCDNNKVYWSKNGTVQDSGGGISITDGYDYAFAINLYNSTAEINFGSPSYSISSGNADANGYGNFEYDPSAGTFDGASKDFYTLNTKNLAEFG